MDPNAALKMMLEHMASGDRDGAFDVLDALRDWMIGGGFMPEQAARELTDADRKETVGRLVTEVRQKLDEIDKEMTR
jgi:hypothetical protein